MRIGIIDCGGANLNSIFYSLQRLGIDSIITNSIKDLLNVDGYILPGVGSANVVMNSLIKNKLDLFIKKIEKPTLGICVGMQVMYEYSEEGNTNCLGLIEGSIKKFKQNSGLPVPQMGWNKVNCIDNYKNLSNFYYFANSFYTNNTNSAVGSSEYGHQITSIVHHNNFLGCQFHPEKSSLAGERFLEEFVKLI
jgi:glutamine amidotransferase|tara:strand:- start:1010 stop:1588 length:579 start_codon:yes stop_codon:yes gene_type:complete